MQKYVLVISKKISWCVWGVDVKESQDANGNTIYRLDDKYRQNYKVYYDLPMSLRYHDIESKYVFDSKLDAQLAADQLIDERLHESVEAIEKKVNLFHQEMDKLKAKKPKGRYRSYLVKDKV